MTTALYGTTLAHYTINKVIGYTLNLLSQNAAVESTEPLLLSIKNLRLFSNIQQLKTREMILGFLSIAPV